MSRVKMTRYEFFACFCVLAVVVQNVRAQGSGTNGNLRVCVVEGRGAYRRAARLCPALDREPSGVECVIGTDRLDCLRRMNKGTVDFGVFSPEDLLAARWAQLEVLVTNELRSRQREFESSIVAIINKRIYTESAHSVESILRNRTLCHPGTGNTKNRGLTDTLVKYLESLLTLRSCDPELSVEENSVKALAQFFGAACKAGPWVLDPQMDVQLKKKYSPMCAACRSRACGGSDRYWGGVGALTCLADGAGDVAWAHLDDVLMYFGKNSSDSYTRPDDYLFLCRDGSVQPLSGTAAPCVWLERPWPVVIAKRQAAATVTRLASSLTNASVAGHDWRAALEGLLDVRAPPPPLEPPRAPLDHLARAAGYAEAYSQSGCNPSRHITICTTTNLERRKCEWLSEAGAVYGVAPPLQCAQRANARACYEAVRRGEDHVVIADADASVAVQRNHQLQPLLFEFTPMFEQLNTVVPYVRKGTFNKMADLRGTRAAIPQYDGVAWHSVIRHLTNQSSIGSCSVEHLAEYFGDSCALGIDKAENVSSHVQNKFLKTCMSETDRSLNNEYESLRSVVEGRNDVAFINLRTYKDYVGKLIKESWAADPKDVVPICPEGSGAYCVLSWSSLGQVYVQKNITAPRRRDIVNVFQQLSQLFGKDYPFDIATFALYGQFDHRSDVLFHSNTRQLATMEQMYVYPYEHWPYNFEKNLTNYIADSCHLNSANAMASAGIVLNFVILVFLHNMQ